MLNESTIAYLSSPAGTELLAFADGLQGELVARITRLRKRWPAELAAAAVELLELRARARRKFERAPEMFFTPQGMEQASGDIIARWRAARFPAGAHVLDLCCGIGGDSLALAARGPVTSVDLDPAAAACAAANARALGAAERMRVRCEDVTTLPLEAEAAFFDPSRRRDGHRVKRAEQYAPPLDFIHAIHAHIPNLAVKVSPALDDETLDSFDAAQEFVSDRGECKEALLWFGALGPGARKAATLLPAGLTLEARPGTPAPPVSEPLAWLAEPDPAVIRAHLVPELAEPAGAALLEPQVAYLTAAAPLNTPFATDYRVLEWHPFNLKRLQAHLKSRGWRVEAIKRRGVPLDPNELRTRLTGAGERPVILVLTRIAGTPTAVLCETGVRGKSAHETTK